MRLGGGGYTIIEVLIFLAVSGMLLVTASLALGGSQAHAEFNTSMSDMNTKLQQWIDDVANGFSGSTATAAVSNFDCTVDPVSGFPTLVTGGTNARGTNVDCIFLGKVIQVNDQPGSNNIITAYPVLGRRTYKLTLPNGGGTIDSPADSLQTANPVPAVFPPHIDLSEQYQIENGVQVVGLKSIDSNDGQGAGTDSSRLFGFFNSFNTEASGVLQCIKLVSPAACATPPGTNLWHLGQMEICFQSAHNGEQAVITINSSAGLGASTNLTFGPCGF